MYRAVVVDGAEDDQGRALFVVSALYHCSDRLRNRVVRFVSVRSAAVRIAAEVLAFDTGLTVQTLETDPETDPATAFENAAVYAAVAFSETSHLGLAEARERGVREVIAIQFPDPPAPAHYAARLAAAHDPAQFATWLCEALS